MMSEESVQGDGIVAKPSNQTDTEPGIQPSKALTIPAKRLAGSARCMNCGVDLQGPFCHYCGQPDRNFLRFFPVLLGELIEDFIGVDSRFLRTLKALLFHPGKLTRDYLAGSRFRYTPPLRLYIFSSMAFFVLAAMLAGGAITITSDDDEIIDESGVINISTDEEVDLDRVRQQLDELDPELAAEVEQAIAAVNDTGQNGEEESQDDDSANSNPQFGLTIDDEDGININGEPWDRETNPMIIPLMPDWVNDWVNDEIEQSPQKGEEIEANPNLIVDKMFDVLPATMFILLPLSALLIKFWYLFANRYYIEHLILALHNHSFLFVIFLVTMLLSALAGWQEPSEEGPITTTVFWLRTAFLSWIPIYFLLSLKRVYQQGWGLTVAKYLIIGLSYMILLITATTIAALLSFILL
jgi:hypothetical protein